MKKISVVLVDDNDDYRWVLAHFLTKHGIEVTAGFTHDLFIEQIRLDVMPDIAVISFDTSHFQTGLTTVFLQSYYSTVKILINSSYNDRLSVDTIIGLKVQGIVFKKDNDPKRILNALNALHENKNYFVE